MCTYKNTGENRERNLHPHETEIPQPDAFHDDRTAANLIRTINLPTFSKYTYIGVARVDKSRQSTNA